MYQKHTHSRTCGKYRNMQCRFNFRTIVGQPVSDDLCEEVKTGILTRQASCYSWHCEEQWNVHNNGCAPSNSSKLLFELIVLISCFFYWNTRVSTFCSILLGSRQRSFYRQARVGHFPFNSHLPGCYISLKCITIWPRTNQQYEHGKYRKYTTHDLHW